MRKRTWIVYTGNVFVWAYRWGRFVRHLSDYLPDCVYPSADTPAAGVACTNGDDAIQCICTG